MRCYNCGFENVARAAYCERCAAPLGGVTPGQVYTPQPVLLSTREKDWRWPVFFMCLGIAIAAVGYAAYFLSFRTMMSDINDPVWDPMDGDGFRESFDLLLLSYLIMGIGGLFFFFGLIWLVLRTG